jgi:hypothetical protein
MCKYRRGKAGSGVVIMNELWLGKELPAQKPAPSC